MKKMRMNKENLVDLVSEMTIGEKVGQLNQFGASIYEKTDDAGIEKLIEDGKVGSLLFVKDVATLNKWQKIAVEKSRLHIPLLFANDIVHGVRTIFPTPLAESCSWEPDLARKTAELSALEGSALGYKWTYAPMVDVVRDSRWGRVMESFGEDTYLTSLFAQAKVEGFQGTEDKIDLNHMAACAKHFVAYGGVLLMKCCCKIYCANYGNSTGWLSVILARWLKRLLTDIVQTKATRHAWA